MNGDRSRIGIILIVIPLAIIVGIILEIRDWRNELIERLKAAGTQQKQVGAEDEQRRRG